MVVEGKNQSIKFTKTKSQAPKVMFVVLICLGVATFALGVLKTVQGIYGPFAGLRADQNQGNILGSGEENTVLDLINMQSQDTDGDGLSDYDEVYVYNTSRFLEDTDSDGYSDQQEVAAGYDPNCAAGRDCWGSEIAGSEESEIVSEIISADSSVGDLSDIDISDLGMTAQELRQQLLESGELTEEQKKELEQVDDQTLVETFLQVLQEQEQQ